jgi:excisionase family DNA binding protein
MAGWTGLEPAASGVTGRAWSLVGVRRGLQVLVNIDDPAFVSNCVWQLLAAFCSFPAANGLLGFESAGDDLSYPPPAGPMLSAAEFARQLGVSKSTVYALCKRGEIPHLRIQNAIRIPTNWGALYLREQAARVGDNP